MDIHRQILIVCSAILIMTGVPSPALAYPVSIYGGDFDLSIPANPDTTKGWMTDAVIQISDHHRIFDLDVRISLTHTNVFDLQLFLQHTSQTEDGFVTKRICLNMYNLDEFFIGSDYRQTIFDDEAATPIENAQPPFTGRFRPRAGSLLEVFDNTDAYGTWHLRIYDAFHADTGSLNSFELIVENPEPASAMLLAVGIVLILLFRPHRRNLKST